MLYIRPMSPMKTWCILSKLTLQTKMGNVRTYIIHEYEMYYVTYRNVICTSACYKRKYDVWCPNLYDIRKGVMSEPMLQTKIWCLVSELTVHTKCVMSEHMLHTNMRYFLFELMLHKKCVMSEHKVHENMRFSFWTYFTSIWKYNMSEPM